MKASELRIGNLVYNNEGERDEEVDLSFFEFLSTEEYYLDYYEPIPLTEEWLLKFGFEKIEFNSDIFGYSAEYHLTVKGHGGFIIEYMDDFSCYLLGDKSDIGVAPNLDSCKYIHQLQNLYFALTNEELTYKP